MSQLDTKGYIKTANRLKRQGKIDEAIAIYKRGIEINPNFSFYYNYLGECLTLQGKLDEAITNYYKALSLRKDDRVQEELDTLLMLKMVGITSSFLQKNKLTNAYLGNAICQYLDRPDILIKLGNFCEKMGKYSEANCVKQAVSVHFEPSSSSKLMLIIFASRNDIQANIQFQFRNLLSKIDINKVFVRDVHDTWYSKGIKNIATNVDGVAHYLKQQVDQIKPAQLITLGSSSGGYAALLFGFLLNADKSITFSPQTKIPRPKPFPDEDLLAGCDSKYFDLLDLEWEDAKTVCSIHFSEDFISDRDAALRMEKYSNFNLYGYQAGKIHNIAGWLKNQSKLESILLELTEAN